MENKEFIYGLYFEFESERFYFYVGRSGRGENRVPGVRFKEHKYHATYDHTPVYVFIREELDDLGIEWKEQILCWCDRDQATTNDTEFYWVVKMIQDGHDLKNAKNGDAEKYVEAARAIKSGFTINSPKDVAGYKKFNKDLIKKEKASLVAATKKQAETGVLYDKFSRKELFSSLKKAENELVVTPEATYTNEGIEAFNKGKFQIALNYVGGSYRRFQEMYGESYYDCI